MGGRPNKLDIPGGEHAIDSDDIFSLEKAPGRVLCIGAGYYSYLWSEVNAVDAYKQFGDELDAAAGRRFRECVLEPGAAAGGAAMMEAFLGRPFREDAYFERLGVPVSS